MMTHHGKDLNGHKSVRKCPQKISLFRANNEGVKRNTVFVILRLQKVTLLLQYIRYLPYAEKQLPTCIWSRILTNYLVSHPRTSIERVQSI